MAGQHSLPSPAASTAASTTSTSTSASRLSKVQRKQQEHVSDCLTFLRRIERIHVTDFTVHDGREHVLFDVILKDPSDPQATAAAAVRKPATKGMRATANYSSMKARSTLKGVHKAVHEWSTRHPYDGAKAPNCAYCSQFNSPSALRLWKSRSRDEQLNQPTTTGAKLTVVVKNSALRQAEECLNSYLTSARAVSEGVNESDCQGLAHIPSMVALFLQNDGYKTIPLSEAKMKCKIM